MKLFVCFMLFTLTTFSLNVFAGEDILRFQYQYGQVHANDKGELLPGLYRSAEPYGLDEPADNGNNEQIQQSGVSVTLDVRQQERIVYAGLDFYNRNSRPAYVFVGGLMPCNHHFYVTTSNIVLSGLCGIYDGVSGWRTIPAMGHYSKVFSLSQAFEFLPHKHRYKISSKRFLIRVGDDIFYREHAEELLFALINWRYGYELKSSEGVWSGNLLAGTSKLPAYWEGMDKDEYKIRSNQVDIDIDGNTVESSDAFQWRVKAGLTPTDYKQREMPQ